MHQDIKVLMAQINPTVGAIQNNAQQIIQIIEDHQDSYDLIVFPELCLNGYPPEDLLFRPEFRQQTRFYLDKIKTHVKHCHVVLGHAQYIETDCFNSLSIFYDGQLKLTYDKQHLPNYSVFDEVRYFTPGEQKTCILSIKEHSFGFLICEDLWQSGPATHLLAQHIDTLIALNASPFDINKSSQRHRLLQQYAKQGVNILYVNQVGGQDELLFDGSSVAMDCLGNICARSPVFAEDLLSVSINKKQLTGSLAPLLSSEELLYRALVYGTQEYVRKNQFQGVIIGLSGGIDSALTLAIAVDALGADKVHAVMMPSQYTANISNHDALEQIHALKVPYSTLPIEPLVNAVQSTLAPLFKGLAEDVTEENIQARARGLLLMALSNKTGKMVLTTSNKSESAVGYATLYGDMAGGLSVLKDVLKTQVYALARFRNTQSLVIPERVITRAPSAELRANQTDQDSLPDYDTLDAIINHYVVHGGSIQALLDQGYDVQTVHRIIALIQRNEYKRQQSAPGIRVSSLAFGKDWRYPITNGFKYLQI